MLAIGDPRPRRLSGDPPGTDGRLDDRRLDHDGPRARPDRDRHRQLAHLHLGAPEHQTPVHDARAKMPASAEATVLPPPVHSIDVENVDRRAPGLANHHRQGRQLQAQGRRGAGRRRAERRRQDLADPHAGRHLASGTRRGAHRRRALRPVGPRIYRALYRLCLADQRAVRRHHRRKHRAHGYAAGQRGSAARGEHRRHPRHGPAPAQRLRHAHRRRRRRRSRPASASASPSPARSMAIRFSWSSTSPTAPSITTAKCACSKTVRELKARGAIVIIVAHRPSALAHCDKVLYIANGAQLAFGPRDEVLQRILTRPVQPGTAATSSEGRARRLERRRMMKNAFDALRERAKQLIDDLWPHIVAIVRPPKLDENDPLLAIRSMNRIGIAIVRAAGRRLRHLGGDQRAGGRGDRARHRRGRIERQEGAASDRRCGRSKFWCTTAAR